MFQNFPFLPPADWHDFSAGSANDLALIAQWNTNLAGFSSQGVIGNPWIADNAFPETPNYFNPASETPAGDPAIGQVQWNVFPGRILGYNPSMPPDEALQLADTGKYDGGTFPTINTNPCTDEAQTPLAYGPYGPRGWQDEYCEWNVQYDAGTNNIRRIDFTCENPEYWNTLWLIDPQMVLQQYQTVLDNQAITLDDLTLKTADGTTTVIDPGTGRPAYNPLNKWNSGPQSVKDAAGNVISGGAMHLTSTPNTIQTEIGLGSNSTVQRVSGNSDKNALICCGQFGQIYRNSDPNIGGTMNALVNKETNGSYPASDKVVTLTNPPGLYIQMPADFSQYSMKNDPDFDFSKCFTVKRGYKGTDPNLPASLAAINTILQASSDFILHLTFEVPEGYSVSDISIDNSNQNLGSGPLQWGGQVAATFNNQILATAYNVDTLSKAISCVGDAGQAYSQAVQLFHQDIYTAMYDTQIQNPVTTAQPLLSNSTFIAPLVKQGSTYTMVLVSALMQDARAVAFYTGNSVDSSVTARITGSASINYSVPGNTYPGSYTALTLTVTIDSDATVGVRGIAIDGNPVMPALINVIA